MVAIDNDAKAEVVKRSNGSVLEREIALSPYFVSIAGVAVFFFVLMFAVGFSFTKIAGLIIFLGIIFSFFVFYMTRVEKYLALDAESIMLLGVHFYKCRAFNGAF